VAPGRLRFTGQRVARGQQGQHGIAEFLGGLPLNGEHHVMGHVKPPCWAVLPDRN